MCLGIGVGFFCLVVWVVVFGLVVCSRVIVGLGRVGICNYFMDMSWYV